MKYYITISASVCEDQVNGPRPLRTVASALLSSGPRSSGHPWKLCLTWMTLFWAWNTHGRRKSWLPGRESVLCLCALLQFSAGNRLDAPIAHVSLSVAHPPSGGHTALHPPKCSRTASFSQCTRMMRDDQQHPIRPAVCLTPRCVKFLHSPVHLPQRHNSSAGQAVPRSSPHPLYRHPAAPETQ
ncbi:hypothetical protein BC629DRAFT_203218 [Irpex lacteus]|nr:hypothetical protein BC629DRAFT_203218 [Irpex lacteus]